MATIINLPPHFGGVSPGAALGGAIGKGLTAFLNTKIEEERRKRMLEGMKQFDEAIRKAGSIEEALSVNPFEFIPPTMVEDAEDISALLQFRSKRAAELFPERQAIVDEEGNLIDVIGKGRARPKGGLTTSEFKDIQAGRADVQKARDAALNRHKFTLTDRKLQIIERMAENERAGRPREQGLTGTELDLVAGDLRDPDTSTALRIAVESKEFYTRAKTPAQKTQFVQTLVDVLKGLRQGQAPTPRQRQQLGEELVSELEQQAGVPARTRARQDREELPPGITSADVDATLRDLQNQGQSVTREQVIRALWRKYPKGVNNGR